MQRFTSPNIDFVNKVQFLMYIFLLVCIKKDIHINMGPLGYIQPTLVVQQALWY